MPQLELQMARKTMWFNQLIELECVNKTVLHYLACVCYKSYAQHSKDMRKFKKIAVNVHHSIRVVVCFYNL